MMGAGPMAGPNMIGNALGMQGMMGPAGPAGPMMVPQMAVKEVIHLKSSILYPPAPGKHYKLRRARFL